jgi:hypothetical protein
LIDKGTENISNSTRTILGKKEALRSALSLTRRKEGMKESRMMGGA